MTAPAPALLADVRQHLLIQRVLRLPVTGNLTDHLRGELPAGTGSLVLLLHAAWQDPDGLAWHVEQVGDRHANLTLHDSITGGDVCCGGDCENDCHRNRRDLRCQDCEVRPHELADGAVREFMEFLRRVCGARALRDVGVVTE